MQAEEGAGDDTVTTLQQRIQALLEQRKSLQEQCTASQSTLRALQEAADRLRGEIAALENQVSVQVPPSKETQGVVPDVSQGDLSLEQLQLYDLQYQKKGLELELQAKESVRARVWSNKKIDRLQRELDQSLNEEKQLAEEISAADEGQKNIPERIDYLKQENQRLERRVASLQKLKKLQKKRLSGESSNDALVEENKLLEDDILAREREKRELEAKVARLKAQRALVQENQEIFMDREELMKRINALDAENQELRGRIFQLRQKAGQPANRF